MLPEEAVAAFALPKLGLGELRQPLAPGISSPSVKCSVCCFGSVNRLYSNVNWRLIDRCVEIE